MPAHGLVSYRYEITEAVLVLAAPFGDIHPADTSDGCIMTTEFFPVDGQAQEGCRKLGISCITTYP